MKEKDISKWAKENRLEFNEETIRFNLHILIARDGDKSTAHCLEFDIIADGETEKEAELTLITSIGNHIGFCFENNRLDKILNYAPKEYWEKFYFCSKPISEPMKMTHGQPWGTRLQDTAKVVRDIDARCLIYA